MTHRVVVAHEAEAIREAALRALREAGYHGVGVADGDEARDTLIAPAPPDALVVDVGLPRRLGYQLVEDVRELGLRTRVILVASVYSKTAYKRRPSTLYGADDYVEQHHIPDQLVPKLARLLPAPRPITLHDMHDLGRLSPREVEEARDIRAAGERRLEIHAASRAEAIGRAQKVARLIVSDLLLYAGAAFDSGLHEGDATRYLAADLAAARDLLAARIPAEVLGTRDFIDEALREFLAARRSGGKG